MEKFTFIAEYKKGTYIQQIKADSLNDAIKLWSEYIYLNNETIMVNESERVKFKSELDKDYNISTQILGMENVWCIYLKIGKYILLINIILTK